MTKFTAIIAISLLSTACSTVRTKYTDPVLRVAIDPETVSEASVAKIRSIAIKTRFFQVVDRGVAFRAAKTEQDLVHGEMSERFAKREKYAQLGKLYGVGGILVPEEHCQTMMSGGGGYYRDCQMTLNLVNASTGEIIAVSTDRKETENYSHAPDWTDAIYDLIDQYPKGMVDNDNPNKFLDESSSLTAYKDALEGKKE